MSDIVKTKEGKVGKSLKICGNHKKNNVDVIKFSCKTTVVMCSVQYLENVTRQFRII